METDSSVEVGEGGANTEAVDDANISTDDPEARMTRPHITQTNTLHMKQQKKLKLK